VDRRDGVGDLRTNLAALPGFGEMNVKSPGAVLFKRFAEADRELVHWHPTLGYVDSPQALDDLKRRSASARPGNPANSEISAPRP
jgi:hypothetical protein